MLVTGITIFLAFWLLWIKLEIQTRLKILNYPFILDISVSVLVWFMYGGTGDGMIAATFAAVIMSVNISVARKLFGYLEESDQGLIYHPGVFNQQAKLNLET